ncbi:MAG: SpoIIE family protein phosphatase [candidate division Zixibacteria bacterium]|nr:SpoIIE family protein phosphatase [candidate division Zixibacteria bacterium]
MQDKREFFDILIEAIRRETDAFNYYYIASEKSPSADTKSLLIQLAEEERRHRIILVRELQNLSRLLSPDKQKDTFLEKDRVSYQIPEEPTLKSAQSIKEVDLAVISLPTEFIGGDYFDSFPIDEKKLGLLIFDVMGHGISATQLKAKVRVTLGRLKELYLEKKASFEPLSPASVVTQLNQKLTEECRKLSSFVSLFYAVLDLSKDRLIYSSAGHEPPMLLGKEELHQLIEADLLMGIDKEKLYSENTIEIHPGDVLVMFTDGIVETLNSQDKEFSRKNLVKVVEENKNLSSFEMVQKILSLLKDFLKGAPLVDEFTLALAKIK